MAFEVYPTTAEHVVGATDASLQKTGGVDEQLVSDFLDTTPDNALNALSMAEQLSLLRKENNGLFTICSPCAAYLCTNVKENKAAITRFVLEQYPPFKTFKSRLYLTGLVGEAANQTRAIHEINAHREIIAGTFTDLGTYAQSLISEGAGLFKPSESGPKTYLSVVNNAIHDRESVQLFIIKRLGSEASTWIDEENVLNNLITAYQRVELANEDARAPIVHAANALESFLTQLANHHGTNISNATGINAKADSLARANQLYGKHKFMIKYLGHVRNAADHGIDQEIGHQWQISPTTAIEYINVTLSVISNLVAAMNGSFKI